MLVALDLATTTGVAWGTNQHGCPVSSTWKLAEGNLPRALCQLRQTLMTLLSATKAECVAIEHTMRLAGREHSVRALEYMISLEAVATEAATRHGARLLLVRPETWRKSFIGIGKLERAAAKRACMARCKQLGWPYADDNAADAMGLWWHCAATVWPKWSPRPGLAA